MESRSKHERFVKLEATAKYKKTNKSTNVKYQSISPSKLRNLSPSEKRISNVSFDSKKWTKDIEKINKQEQVIIKAIKELNSKYNAAKAKINQSKKNLVKEDIQDTKAKEIEKSLMQIDSKLKRLKKKHLPNESFKKFSVV
jgi:hypothetical protein